jgi:DNA-binding MarR family transcriptional regulator
MKARALRGHRHELAEPPEPVHGPQGDALRALVQRFVREIGLLSSDRTPCGKPISVSHAHALMVLLEHRRAGRHPTQRELGRILGIDKSNVARLCRKMESSGQLVQHRGIEDGRMRLLTLTDRGVRLARSVEESSRERFRRLITAVPDDERGTVLSALAVLNEALAASAMPGPDSPARGSRRNVAGIPTDARERPGEALAPGRRRAGA